MKIVLTHFPLLTLVVDPVFKDPMVGTITKLHASDLLPTQTIPPITTIPTGIMEMEAGIHQIITTGMITMEAGIHPLPTTMTTLTGMIPAMTMVGITVFLLPV